VQRSLGLLLIADVHSSHVGLRQRLQHFVLVGQVDEQSMLVQEGLDLVLVNTSALAQDLFYQLVGPYAKLMSPWLPNTIRM